MPRTPIAPPCPECGETGTFAGLDVGGFDLFVCPDHESCTVNEYRRGMVVSRARYTPPGESPPPEPQ